jgi:hypothetical protein
VPDRYAGRDRVLPERRDPAHGAAEHVEEVKPGAEYAGVGRNHHGGINGQRTGQSLAVTPTGEDPKLSEHRQL